MTTSRRSRLTIGFLISTAFVSAQTQVRVNVGGGSFVDLAGNTWAADSGCSSSSTFSRGSAISNTVDPTLYRTGRSDNSAVSCSFAVTNNTFFFVTLRFAETDPSVTRAGQRIFNVFVNGALRYPALDVYNIARARNTALDLAIGPVPVSNSQIVVTLATVAGSGPTLQAISAISASSGGDSTWTNAGAYLFNNTGGGVHITSSDFTSYGGTFYNPAGITQAQFNPGTTQGTTPYVVYAAGITPGTFGVVNVNGGLELYLANKAKQVYVSNLPLHSSDVCSDWYNKDDLGDLTGVYDVQLCRGAARQLDLRDELSNPAAIKVSKVIVSGTTPEGTCDSTQRGRVVYTQGGAGVADTLRICRKDAADAYAWTALY